jgi:putative membrane protein
MMDQAKYADRFISEQRLHPLSMFYRAIVSLPGYSIAFFVALMNADQFEFGYLFIMIAIGVIVFPSIFLSYFYFYYWITPEELIIRSGVISKKQRNIPIRRIQNIEITQNFLQRILGIAVVKAETAGDSQTEGHLEFVSNKDAEKIREVIRSYQLQTEEENNEGAETSETIGPEAEKSNLIFKLGIKDLIIYGMLRFRPMALFFGFVVFQWINIIPGLNERVFGEYDLDFLETLNITELILFLLGAVFIIIILSIIIDVMLTINQYYQFTLKRDGDKLMTDQGLLGRRKGTIPLKKVQYISMNTNTLAKKFSLSGLRMQTAGLGTRKGLPEVAIPLASDDRVLGLGQSIQKFEHPFDLLPISKKFMRRQMIKLFIYLLPLAAITFYLYPPALYIFTVYPLLFIPVYFKWKNFGYSIQNKHVIIKKGLVFHETLIVPIEKIQTVIFYSGFFQRQLGLASLNIDTAGTSVFDEASIVDIEYDTALEIKRKILDLYQEYLAQKEKLKNI